MQFVFLFLSILLLLVGHLFRLRRWEQFIRIYEKPMHGSLLRSMALGYAVNFLVPLHLGDLFRAAASGRKMRNGIGFSLATVVMDRFLDVWFVTAIFAVFSLLGPARSATLRYYLLFSLALLILSAAVFFLRDMLKRVGLAVCSIFNEGIRLKAMMFLWSLIHTFKDLSRIDLRQLLLNTAAMWCTYLASYAAFARCLTRAGFGHTVYDVFCLLFGPNAVSLTTFASIGEVESSGGKLLMAVWLLLPLAVMALLPLLPQSFRSRAAAVMPQNEEDYVNLIPQSSEQDRSRFLTSYFNLKNKDYVANFLKINEHVTILQDYSAGSNATTMLCMDRDELFFRKYAFGKDGEKLAEQRLWLEENAGRVPLCRVLRGESGEDFCWYDMPYEPETMDLFRYLHSAPLASSRAVLREILTSLQSGLYSQGTAVSRTDHPENIRRYIEEKAEKNLERIRSSRTLRELYEADTVVINGTPYRGLKPILAEYPPESWAGYFAADPLTPVHGDLTVENIICRIGEKPSWYLIDPNTGNLHDTSYLDFAKLLQSLHGGYEFLMRTPYVTVSGNHIDFSMTRSSAYDALLKELRAYLAENFSAEAQKSIYLHELIHWLRLMPYKISKDRDRAPMFYAGLVMVANDVRKELNT